MASAASHTQSYALAIASIVQNLVDSYEQGETVNLTTLKSVASKRYKLQGIPKMADILQGLPMTHREKLWPYLQTKPVRTASGGTSYYDSLNMEVLRTRRRMPVYLPIPLIH